MALALAVRPAAMGDAVRRFLLQRNVQGGKNFTLLLQDVQGGLQVEKDGGWIDATPVPGTFVINIGEILELASNGYLKATVHRVVTPPSGKDRLSVAFFFGADLKANVPVLTLPPELAAEAGGEDTDPDNPETPTPEEEASPYKADLREIFPFCIPFDLIHLLKVFDAEAEAPVFEFPLDIEMDNPWTGEKVVDYHHTFKLDMADYEPVIKILRIFQVIFFIIALMLITRQQMIKG